MCSVYIYTFRYYLTSSATQHGLAHKSFMLEMSDMNRKNVTCNLGVCTILGKMSRIHLGRGWVRWYLYRQDLADWGTKQSCPIFKTMILLVINVGVVTVA